MSKSSTLMLLLLSCLVTTTASALPEDAQQPISIKAERSALDNANGLLTYDGMVTFTQGSITIFADHLEVRLESGRITFVEATGFPAQFTQITDSDGTILHAEGDLLRYNVKTQNLHINLNAVVIEGKNRMSGGTIDYQLDTGYAEIVGDPNVGDGRMELLFMPTPQDDI